MEKNNTKRTLESIATIIAMIYCVIDIIFEIISICNLIELSRYYRIEASYIIGFIIGVALVIATLVVSIQLLRKVYSVYDEKEAVKKLRIAFIVLSFVMIIIFLIGLIIGSYSVLSIIGLILFIGVVIMESLVLSMKEPKTTEEFKASGVTNPYNKFYQTTQASKVVNSSEQNLEQKQSFESKVNELKHLLSLKVITKEQFDNAVQELAKEVINKE